MRARLGTLAVGALLAGSCGGESEESAPTAGRAPNHAVAHHQEELGELGYYDGPHDGVFGDDTHEALKKLQADEGLDESGKLDRPTRAVLGELAGKSDALSLKAVQSALTELGLYTGPIDGELGPGTEAALEDLQREAGIEVDGAFGPETATALNELYEEQVVVKKPVEETGDTSADQGEGLLKQGDRGDAVAELQRRLAELGYRPGEADGVFGAETASAVMAFEKHEGLGRDGVGGPQVQERLESPQGTGPRTGGPSLYKPLYFDQGWAVHGAASVPGYPASHSCVRASDDDQDFVSQAIPQDATVIIHGTSRGEPGPGQPGF